MPHAWIGLVPHRRYHCGHHDEVGRPICRNRKGRELRRALEEKQRPHHHGSAQHHEYRWRDVSLLGNRKHDCNEGDAAQQRISDPAGPEGCHVCFGLLVFGDTTREGLIYPARSMKVDLEELPQLPLTNYMMESPVLDVDPCIGCSKCVDNCPTNCIIMDEGPQNKTLKSGKTRNVENPYFDYTICIGCSTCVKVCPADCLHMEPISNSSSSGLSEEGATTES